MEIQSSKNPELAKLYFMGFSTKEKREAGLQEYISKLKEQYDVLNAICKEAENVKVPDKDKDILHYQKKDMKSIKLANSPITYFISGTDRTEWILFIHAAFVNHNMFKSQFEYFHNKYNILTIDIIGHGQSRDTKKGDGIDKMSEWIFDILKVENIEKVHIGVLWRI